MGQRIAVLHEGRLRQVGAPREVYERPADTFVARFIGSPGMNVLETQASDAAATVGLGGTLTLPADAVAGAPLVGVRPEHVSLVAAGRGQGDALVRIVEPLGAETLVHVDAGGVRLVARLRGLKAPAVGVRVGVRLDPARLHRFDAAGTRRA